MIGGKQIQRHHRKLDAGYGEEAAYEQGIGKYGKPDIARQQTVKFGRIDFGTLKSMVDRRSFWFRGA